MRVCVNNSYNILSWNFNNDPTRSCNCGYVVPSPSISGRQTRGGGFRDINNNSISLITSDSACRDKRFSPGFCNSNLRIRSRWNLNNHSVSFGTSFSDGSSSDFRPSSSDSNSRVWNRSFRCGTTVDTSARSSCIPGSRFIRRNNNSINFSTNSAIGFGCNDRLGCSRWFSTWSRMNSWTSLTDGWSSRIWSWTIIFDSTIKNPKESNRFIRTNFKFGWVITKTNIKILGKELGSSQSQDTSFFIIKPVMFIMMWEIHQR